MGRRWVPPRFSSACPPSSPSSPPWVPNSTYAYVVLREVRHGETSRTAQILGITDEKLKEQVAFEEACEIDQIQITSKQEDQASGNYRLQACGKALRYRRIGTVYSKVNADL